MRVCSSSLDEFVCGLAERLGIIHAAPQALTFLRHCGVPASPGHSTTYSDVAPGSLPVEFSFSQACSPELRLLAEPCLPGEGILARTVVGIEAVGKLAAEMPFSPKLAHEAQRLTRHLLPEGEEVAHLNWRSSVWIALRTTGKRSTVRIYVNAQFRDAPDRWLHISRALSACGLEESKRALTALRKALGDLVQPIGLSFDLRSSGLKPARVHCVTEKLSPYRLLKLLALTETQGAIEDAADFLKTFNLLERRGTCPVLVSFGLEQENVRSLKIDVDLPSLVPDADARREANYLRRVEARFGEIASYRMVDQAFAHEDPRYIGITMTGASSFLNVYFPCPALPPSGAVPRLDEALKKARIFLRAQLGDAGALKMDARSIGTLRPVPPGWVDIYMTCLVLQEQFSASCLGDDVLERARSDVQAAREEWGWRYLPDLPCDLDDTAMALAALGSTDTAMDNKVIRRILAAVNSDGGYPTFVGEHAPEQPSHPAVTLNIVFALDQVNGFRPKEETDQYLRRWLQQPDFPYCRWLGSRLFPIFLFARNRALLDRLGSWAGQRLVEYVIATRKPDGSWGGALPDSLDTALAVLALERLGAPVPDREALKSLLLAFQHEGGNWGWSPFYSDGNGTWFGHQAVTTALTISALSLLDPAGYKNNQLTRRSYQMNDKKTTSSVPAARAHEHGSRQPSFSCIVLWLGKTLQKMGAGRYKVANI